MKRLDERLAEKWACRPSPLSHNVRKAVREAVREAAKVAESMSVDDYTPQRTKWAILALIGGEGKSLQ